MPKKRITPPKVKVPTMTTIKSCLNKDAQLAVLRRTFELIPDRRDGGTIPLADVLMSGYAVFDLKDPSLLAFDNRRTLETANFNRVYGISQVACDTQMRTVLDWVDPKLLCPNFKAIINQLQRGKVLDQFAYYEGHYLVSMQRRPVRSLHVL